MMSVSRLRYLYSVTNEPWTGDVEAACSGQISMAETRDNGYVHDKLLKKKKKKLSRMFHCSPEAVLKLIRFQFMPKTVIGNV